MPATKTHPTCTILKNLTENGEPQRYSWGTQKKKNHFLQRAQTYCAPHWFIDIHGILPVWWSSLFATSFSLSPSLPSLCIHFPSDLMDRPDVSLHWCTYMRASRHMCSSLQLLPAKLKASKFFAAWKIFWHTNRRDRAQSKHLWMQEIVKAEFLHARNSPKPTWAEYAVQLIPHDLHLCIALLAWAADLGSIPTFDVGFFLGRLGLYSYFRCGFLSGLSHTSDLKIVTPVAALPGAWHYRVSTMIGWHDASILLLGETESLICNLYLAVAAHTTVPADLSLRCTDMLLGCQATNNNTAPLHALHQTPAHHSPPCVTSMVMRMSTLRYLGCTA